MFRLGTIDIVQVFRVYRLQLHSQKVKILHLEKAHRNSLSARPHAWKMNYTYA